MVWKIHVWDTIMLVVVNAAHRTKCSSLVSWNCIRFGYTSFHISHCMFLSLCEYCWSIHLLSDATRNVIRVVSITKECDNCMIISSCAICIRLSGITLHQWRWRRGNGIFSWQLWDMLMLQWYSLRSNSTVFSAFAYLFFSYAFSHRMFQHVWKKFHCNRRMFCFFCWQQHILKEKKSFCFWRIWHEFPRS